MIKAWGQEVVFKKYPNGELYIDFEASNLKWLKDALKEEFYDIVETTIEFKWENDSDLIKLMLFKEYLNDLTLAPTLIIYSMPYARADRSENGSPFMLKYIAEYINMMMFKKVIIVEPHSDVTLQLVDNSEYFRVTDKLFAKAVSKTNFKMFNDFVVFPDKGSATRYDKLGFDELGFNTIFFSKDRDFETGEIKGLNMVGNPDPIKMNNGRAIIIDDLSSRGGTFYYTAKELRKQGFTEVYLVIAHCEDTIFSGELLKEGSPIDKIFTTNSMFTSSTEWVQKKHIEDNKLEIFDISELIKNGENEMIGQRFKSVQCGWYTVISKESNGRWKVEFDEINGIKFKTIREKRRVLSGSIKNPYHPLRLGVASVGNVNSKDYPKEFNKWRGMIERCYDPNNNHYNAYGAKGIIVCKRWLCFEFFLNDLPNLEGYNYDKIQKGELHLDKDIKGDRTMYSPENCILTSPQENVKEMNKRVKEKTYIATNIINGSQIIFINQTEFANFLGLYPGNIFNCVQGKQKTFGNYEIKLMEDKNEKL